MTHVCGVSFTDIMGYEATVRFYYLQMQQRKLNYLIERCGGDCIALGRPYTAQLADALSSNFSIYQFVNISSSQSHHHQ